MKTIWLWKLSLALVTAAVYAIAPRLGLADGVEDVLKKANSLPAEERQRLLIENAKKEGTVTFYAATNLRDTQEVVAGFNKHYPFVKVAFSSLGGPGVLNKVSTEYRAGAYQADVVTLTGSLRSRADRQENSSAVPKPDASFSAQRFCRSRRVLAGRVRDRLHDYLQRPASCRRKMCPKRYEDLLNPRWKDNMIMDMEAHDLLAGLIDLWGESKATAFLRRLASEQKVRLSRQSHSFMTQLVATGEHDLIVDGYVHNAVAFKEKAAPLDFVMMNPTFIRPPSTIAITSQAPHPYAAALLLDYHLSKEASEIMVKNQGRWAPRKDVPWTRRAAG